MFKRQAKSRGRHAVGAAAGTDRIHHSIAWRVVHVLLPALLIGGLAGTFLGVGVATAAPSADLTIVSSVPWASSRQPTHTGEKSRSMERLPTYRYLLTSLS